MLAVALTGLRQPHDAEDTPFLTRVGEPARSGRRRAMVAISLGAVRTRVLTLARADALRSAPSSPTAGTPPQSRLQGQPLNDELPLVTLTGSG
jgi:hypothetical protein